MSELLFFVLGLVIGSLSGITIMCMFQINKMRAEYNCEIEQ